MLGYFHVRNALVQRQTFTGDARLRGAAGSRVRSDMMARKNNWRCAVRHAVLAAAIASALPPAYCEPIISELMASNSVTLPDQDQAFSDWIEIHNPDATAINLNGWYLTDTATNKTRWQFPSVTIPAGGYLVVFASNKNRQNAGAELHTNFALAADGEYLGLIRPDGTSVVSEYAPFPAQFNDVSFGLVTLPGGVRWFEPGWVRRSAAVG